ncbi:MAG: HAD-IIB family hydrolase [Pseudomonadota bacterium]
MSDRLQPLSAFPPAARRRVRFVLCDIDDTLTRRGRLVASAYAAIERLGAAGLAVVPVTGRPAGWCDLIARQWPVAGVVGENGALYFRYDEGRRRMIRRYWRDAEQRRADRDQLTTLGRRILAEVPGAAIAADQSYRDSDLAIDWCEDVARLSDGAVERILAIAGEAGAHAKLSSIHVNIWFGEFDKLAMTRVLMRDCFSLDLDAHRHEFAFVGDSPNDAPMFAFFPLAIGVANVLDFRGRLACEPVYITAAPGGEGFVEAADALLSARAPVPAPR